MIINTTHRFIFIHIPKCGGTALTVDLSPLIGMGDMEIGVTRFGGYLQKAYNQRRFPLSKHSPAARVVAAIGLERWRHYLTFTLVRNPFTRAVSAYRFAQRWRGWRHRAWIDGSRTVNEFIAHPCWLASNGTDGLLRPQVDFTGHHTGIEVDTVFKLESYEECLRAIYRRAGREPPGRALGSRNAAPPLAEPEALQLDSASIDLILRKYAADFDAFGYDRCPPP